MTDERKHTEFISHNYDAVNQGVIEVARRATIFSDWLRLRVFAERIKLISILLIVIGFFLILLAIAFYIGRGYLSIKHETGGTKIEYIKVPDPEKSRIIEKTVVVEKPVYIPAEVPEEDGVKISYTVFRTVKQDWGVRAQVVTGLNYENSKQKYPEDQYCYVTNDRDEDSVFEKVDLAYKDGENSEVIRDVTSEQAGKLGLTYSQLSRLNGDCQFLAAGITLRPDQGSQPDFEPIDPSGVKLSSGTGFFVNPEGYIVTNEHVVSSCDVIAVRVSGSFERLSLVSSDKALDLAILRSYKFRNKDFLTFSNSVETGQDVYAFGFPLSDQLSEEIKVTNGIISSLSGINNDETRMQITNALQPGNSGGPLTDAFGLTVGVNVSGLRGEIYQNVNFSIKRENVLGFLAKNKIEFFVDRPSSEKETVDIVRDMKKSVFPIFCAVKPT